MIVAIAEVGDKTQLLSFVLACKCRRKLPVILGIFVATLANHSMAGLVGKWVATLASPQTMTWIVAVSFFIFGFWALKPDKLEENTRLRGTGIFLTSAIAFFIVEIGDKTQLATVALAIRFDMLIPVVMGTTLGMMIANIPAVMLGKALAQKVDMKKIRWLAAGLFFLMGALSLFVGEDAPL